MGHFKMIRQTIILTPTLLLTVSFIRQETDELYLNYVAAVKNHGTFQYFLVVKVKDINTGQTREICTKGNFLRGSLHREYNLPYEKGEDAKVATIALNSKDRYFEFKNDSALLNIGINDYSMADLTELEKQIDFDALAKKIKKKKKWSLKIFDDKKIYIYAHALFNRGIMTGENSCWGGTLEYVDRNSAE